MGRVCDGYGIWGGGGSILPDVPSSFENTEKILRTAERAERCAPTSLAHRETSLVMPGPRLSQEEKHYLDWFFNGKGELSSNATEMKRKLTSSFPRVAIKSPEFYIAESWWSIVVQATVDNPMILQALLALSAAHKRKTLEPTNWCQQGRLSDAHEIFLMEQYGGAMRNMRQLLGSEKAKDRWQLLWAVISKWFPKPVVKWMLICLR